MRDGQGAPPSRTDVTRPSGRVITVSRTPYRGTTPARPAPEAGIPGSPGTPAAGASPPGSVVIGVASNALTVVTAGAFQAGGTDICPMVPAPRIAAETSPGPRSAPSDSDLAMLVSGARNAGAMSAGGERPPQPRS